MKLFTFKLVVVLLIALLAPMIIPGPDGKPIMSIDDWIPRDLLSSIGRSLDSARTMLSGAMENASDVQEAVSGDSIYRWRDAQGVLHYSDTPVADAEAVELIDNTLEIPAKNFVEHGMVQGENNNENTKARSVLLKETPFAASDSISIRSKSRTPPADLSDIEALVNGDFSNSADVLQNLPELLEQAKQARRTEPESRR